MNFVKENESRGKLDKDLDNISKTIKEELSKIILPLLDENIDFKKTLIGHKFVQDILIEFNKTKLELDELKSRINKKNITLTISEKLEENDYVCGNVYDDVSLMLKQTSNDNVKKIPLDLDYDSILKEYDNDPEMQDNVPIGTSVMDDYWITMKKVSNISDEEESKAIQIWRTKNNDSTKSNNEIIVDIINECGGIKKWLMMHGKEAETIKVIKNNLNGDETTSESEEEESLEPVVQETEAESEEESVEPVVEETVAESEEESLEPVLQETAVESEEESVETVVQETVVESEEESVEHVVEETVAESEETAVESEEEADETVVEETTVESEEDSEESVVEETTVESEEAEETQEDDEVEEVAEEGETSDEESLEVEDFEYNGKMYLITDSENGTIYQCDSDGDIMYDDDDNEVVAGYMKNGDPFFS
jgi:chemotaxis protein histidine kinase CheA